nr:unnamed protein product [Digitaria exilis]
MSTGDGEDSDDALRSLLGAGRKLHLLIRTSPPPPRPRAAGGASARRTSSRFPFPVGTRATPLQLLGLLGATAAAWRALAPHQLLSARPDGDALGVGNPGRGVPGRGPAAPGTGLMGRGRSPQ